MPTATSSLMDRQNPAQRGKKVFGRIEAGMDALNAFFAKVDAAVTAAIVVRFNYLLGLLDTDAGVTDTDYASTLVATTGNIVTKINALLAKLDADTLVNQTTWVSGVGTVTAATLATSWRALLAKVDTDSGIVIVGQQVSLGTELDTNHVSTLAFTTIDDA